MCVFVCVFVCASVVCMLCKFCVCERGLCVELCVSLCLLGGKGTGGLLQMLWKCTFFTPETPELFQGQCLVFFGFCSLKILLSNLYGFFFLGIGLTGLGPLLEPPTGLGGVFDLHDVTCAVESTKCAQTGHNLAHTYLGLGAFALFRGCHVEKELCSLDLYKQSCMKNVVLFSPQSNVSDDQN